MTQNQKQFQGPEKHPAEHPVPAVRVPTLQGQKGCGTVQPCPDAQEVPGDIYVQGEDRACRQQCRGLVLGRQPQEPVIKVYENCVKIISILL